MKPPTWSESIWLFAPTIAIFVLMGLKGYFGIQLFSDSSEGFVIIGLIILQVIELRDDNKRQEDEAYWRKMEELHKKNKK